VTSDSDTTRRLILLRHAKSDWPDVPDHDRPLAKRGRKDAPVIGRWLDSHGYVPDTVICSTARRTRQTWELVAPELDRSPEVRFEPRAYAASALTLLYLARELPSQSRAVLLIAHNPGIEDLANSLAAQPGEDTESRSQGLRFPTAAVAVFGYVGDWPGLALGRARLLDSTTPADLKVLTPWTREARPPSGPPPAAAP
jgi:phosphohistidine phosphatase